MENNTISIISLLVALLAVFFGPIISIIIAKMQLKGVSRQILSPIRQKWINELTEVLAKISSKSLHYWTSGFEDRSDEDYYELTFLEYKLGLLLDTKTSSHLEIIKIIRELVSELQSTKDNTQKFQELHEELMDIGRKILKHEREKIEKDI